MMDENSPAELAANSVSDPVGEPWLNLDYAPRSMDFMTAVKDTFRKGLTVKGRASRSQFWWAYLGFAIIQIPISLFTVFVLMAGFFRSIDLESILNGDTSIRFAFDGTVFWMLGAIGLVISLIVNVPLFTATVRRLHDGGRTGWWFGAPMLATLLLNVFMFTQIGTVIESVFNATQLPASVLIAQALGSVVGLFQIVVLVFLILPGTMGPNRYGPGDQQFFPIEQFPNLPVK